MKIINVRRENYLKQRQTYYKCSVPAIPVQTMNFFSADRIRQLCHIYGRTRGTAAYSGGIPGEWCHACVLVDALFGSDALL